MFGNGNNQAMQFIAQGYSDSIKTYNDQSAGNLMKNLSGLQSNYFQNQASIENTEGQRLQNHYNRENMQTALDQQKEHLESQKLDNQFNRDSMKDRLSIVNSNARIGRTEATYGEGTLKSNIAATNSQNRRITNTEKSDIAQKNAWNYASVANSNLNKKLDTMQRQNYEFEDLKFDKKRGVYTSGKRVISNDEAEMIKARNNQKQQNINDYMATHTTHNRATKTQNMAQEAQNQNNVYDLDRQLQFRNSQAQFIKNAGETEFSIKKKVNEALLNGQDSIMVGGESMPISMFSNIVGYAENLNSNNNMNIQNVTMPKPNLLVDARDSALAINEISQMPSEQQDAFFKSAQGREAVNNLVNTNPTTRNKITEYQGNIESLGYVTNDIQALQGHRLKAGIGKFTKLLGLNDEAEAMNIMAKYANSNSIIETLKGLKGAASDRDMALVAKNAFSLWQSDAANAQVMLNLNRSQLVQYNKLISTIGGNPKALLALPQGERMYREYMECNALVNGLSGAYNNMK